MVSPIRIRVPPLTKALQITRKIGDMRKSLSLSPVHRLGGRTTVASGYEGVPQHLEEDLGSGVAGEEQGSTRVSQVANTHYRQPGALQQGPQGAVARV